MHTSISIPKPLYNKIKKYIKGTGFTSVSSFVIYVLRQVISGTHEKNRKELFSKEDEQRIKERLKTLGYI